MTDGGPDNNTNPFGRSADTALRRNAANRWRGASILRRHPLCESKLDRLLLHQSHQTPHHNSSKCLITPATIP